MGQLPVCLDDVIVNAQLTLRPSRPPDYKAEIDVIKLLVDTMSEAPDTFWQKLAETALQLCHAGTAGVSLLGNQDGTEVLRSEAVAGVLRERLNSTIPRASPCGAAIDRDGTLLMYLPERFFSDMKFDPPIVEALIIPFHVQNKPVGTIWCVAHDDSYKFDSEDERIGRTLASFAAAAWHIQKAWDLAEPATGHDLTSELVGNRTSQEEMFEPRRMQEKLRELSQNLEARASEETADLIAAKDRVALTFEREDLQKEVPQTDIRESAGRAPRAVFDTLLNIIQGYATLMKNDLNDPIKLKEDIEAISDAINKSGSLVQKIIRDSHKE